MTGIATVAAIKHQRRQSPAERRHPHPAGGDGYRSGPMACKAYLRSESTSGGLSSTGRSHLVAWVSGGRCGFATAPGERAVLEHHREGAYLIIVERGAVLDLQVQVRRERAARVADGGDPLT